MAVDDEGDDQRATELVARVASLEAALAERDAKLAGLTALVRDPAHV